MSRLASGGVIDRTKILRFTFDGRLFVGHPGDTLVSALIANDVRLVGRSFKYHRPRGIFGFGAEEPNALVELRTGARREPNTRATTTELFEGLEAASQNRWPSLGFDLMAVNRLFAPLLTAGFYYKTFMWPAAFWEKLYEPLIRRAAGLGRAADAPDPDHYEKANAFCDVLVIGAGPTGLMAALAAGRAGARVILADDDFCLGGRLNAERHVIDDLPGEAFIQRILGELAGLKNVRVMPRTAVFGVYDGGTYGALERVADHCLEPPPFVPRQRLWRIVAKRAVLAAGAIERPIAFGDNDRPGIMLASAAQAFIHRFAAVPARRMAIFCNNDAAWRSAFDMAEAGCSITAIIDVRDAIAPALHKRAEGLGIRVILNGQVQATQGKVLRSIDVSAGAASGRISVDGLAISGGFSPSMHLTSHHGGRPVWNEDLAAFTAGTPPPGMTVAGAAAGKSGLAACLADGAEAGAKAATDTGFSAPPITIPSAEDAVLAIKPFWHVAASKGPMFVDFQNDVTVKDLKLARQEGLHSVEHVKRYTTLGMATDQGKTGNVVALGVMAALSGESMGAIGTTLIRPPAVPVAIAAFAGHARDRDFRPLRVTPTHAFAEELGAEFIEAGAWLRASYFPRPGEADWFAATAREVMAVRQQVGVVDMSTFGKIDISGPDAGLFLDRVTVNRISKLSVGKCRYILMLREDGIVFDDATVARLAPDRFLMSATTAHGAKVLQNLEFYAQVLWPELDVQILSVSEQWAQLALAGPHARDVLRRVADDPDAVSDASLPFLGVVERTVMGGVRARLFRLSFSGELSFEIAVPARQGEALMRALVAEGRNFGITPYGLEAMMAMRIEKGHVAGPELNGRTTARDLLLHKMVAKDKTHIGGALAGRPGLIDPDRPTLAGFRPVDAHQRLRSGAHFIGVGVIPSVEADEGYMTSTGYSPTLKTWIGLGLIRHGPERIGERVRAYDPIRGGDVEVEIVSPVFLDPEGARLRG